MEEKEILQTISPIDGRYFFLTKELREYFSEYALIKKRIYIEILYFIELVKLKLPKLKDFKDKDIEKLLDIYNNFDLEEALEVKKIEKIVNHDVKAVEIYLRNKFDNLGLGDFKEYIHFGLTSQDINNTAIPLIIKEFLTDKYFVLLESLINVLKEKAKDTDTIVMLARTHGQPASPTRMGKEFNVFVERLENLYLFLKNIPICSKFGGATGNFNAHKIAFPNIDWINFANNFVNNVLKLKRLQFTTQIEHYDFLSMLFNTIKQINTVLIDLAQDLWFYISLGYFKIKIKKEEVGSSTMPHKINPINFENAEGNLLYANSIFEFFSRKLPISRLQRDLTDSTILRNLGVPFAHSFIAYKNIIDGINKIEHNLDAINKDLNDNWEVLTEALQVILRRESYKNAYDIVKELVRTNSKINKETLTNFIKKLDIDEKVKNELLNLSPFNYI